MTLTKREWQRKHQHFESGWWGDCANTFGEELKQLAYARVMGLDPGPWLAGNPWPVHNVDGAIASVLDIGGGPVSMLLKTVGLKRATVVDPCSYPDWVTARYREHGVEYIVQPAEEHDTGGWIYDEAWIYNVLQHTIDPQAIIAMMRRSARRIRIFEWVETEAYLGHPHSLHVEQLQEWCGGEGQTVWLDEQYRQVDPSHGAADRVEQQAWGGAFDS